MRRGSWFPGCNYGMFRGNSIAVEHVSVSRGPRGLVISASCLGMSCPITGAHVCVLTILCWADSQAVSIFLFHNCGAGFGQGGEVGSTQPNTILMLGEDNISMVMTDSPSCLSNHPPESSKQWPSSLEVGRDGGFEGRRQRLVHRLAAAHYIGVWCPINKRLKRNTCLLF